MDDCGENRINRKRRCPFVLSSDHLHEVKRHSPCDTELSTASFESNASTGNTTRIIDPRINRKLSSSQRSAGFTLWEFYSAMLTSRGYDSSRIEMRSDLSSRYLPKEKIDNYAADVIAAIYNSDMDALIALKNQNRPFDACNKFFESLLHKACRWSRREIVEFLLSNGADPFLFDDHGRLPLHDACWRSNTDFVLVRHLLKLDPSMLRRLDSRGNSPLDYVRKEHHKVWCFFLYKCRDDFWPVRSNQEDHNDR